MIDPRLKTPLQNLLDLVARDLPALIRGAVLLAKIGRAQDQIVNCAAFFLRTEIATHSLGSSVYPFSACFITLWEKQV